MTATAHALVGGAIAASIKDPTIGIFLSAASHPILDMIPHWDAAWNWREKSKLRFFAEALTDLIVGCLLTFYLFGGKTDFWYLSLAILASVVWDIMEVPFWFFKWHFPPFSWSHKVQSHLQGKAALPWGIVSQVITVGIIILILNLISGS